ncbi:YciI family protein [Paenibacillus thiaminolyticus]|uniref:YciI family protein n=1 Tax=Paenibacillus thiaminolyticus TaxID=49283 RepID=UPI00217584AE|nr:YciI family protein [Paenibacillus thiaminolyticus]
MPEHAVYVQKISDQGNVLLGGPFADGAGGAVVLDVESEERAIELAANDPAVKSGVFTYQVKEWSTVFSKYEGNKSNYDQGYIDYKHEKQKELGIYDWNE